MNKISDVIESIPLAKLRELRDQITHRYKTKKQKGIVSVEEAIAYLAFRSPATTAVQERVFKEFLDSNFTPQTMVDLGAGPGLSYENALCRFPSIQTYIGIEENPYMIDIGKKLNNKIDWIQQSYLNTDIPKADLVLGSYTFSELGEPSLITALEKAWQAAQDCLVIIEPGTPEGFQTILKCRDFLIENGGCIYAPCGHNGACPINPKNDWCHFSQRLERTKLHRAMKAGSLPYEDEKYCYLIATKENWNPDYKRILRPPVSRKGHITLDLCAPKEMDSNVYTKSKNKDFKTIKKLGWGDRLKSPE